MKTKKIHLFHCILLLFTGLISSAFSQEGRTEISGYDIDFYDTSRQRLIPVAVTKPDGNNTDGLKVIVMNHGYDKNMGGSYKTYSYLTDALAANGIFVISIQHELPDDDFLAMEGNFYETRMPNWKRGMENILFAIGQFKKIYPELDWGDTNLIGHSNGGDMCMLFAREYPELAKRIISLDHRRMPIPHTNRPRLYSLRGSDYDADEGVLPTVGKEKKYGIRIINLENIEHSDMDNKGTPEQHRIIVDYILSFLND